MIQLRAVVETDLETLYEHQSDPIGRAMAVFGGRDRETFMAHWQKILSDREVVARAVTFEGAVVGNVGSWPREGKRYVGYWLGREFWGRGFATAAVRAFVEDLSERPLYALVVDTNAASKRVLEKSGFVPTTNGPDAGPDGVLEWLFRLD